MNKRFVWVFVFAVLVALGTSVALYRILPGRLGAAQLVTVPVAMRDLPVGTVIREVDLRAGKWNGALPRGTLTVRTALVDRAVVNPISAGEIINEARLAPKGGGTGLASKIPAGKRAIAVRVNEVVGLAGFVTPGMRVDVVAWGQAPDRERKGQDLGSQSRTILQNIEVLSAGQQIQSEAEGKPVTAQVVNLLVTPEEAEVLSLAGNEAKIQLVLRNPLDQEKVETPGTSEANLFGGRVQAPPKSAAVPTIRASAKPVSKPPVMEKVTVPITMEIIQGAKRNDVKVGETVEERVKEEKAGPRK